MNDFAKAFLRGVEAQGAIAIDGANTVKTVAMAALVGGCVIKWSAQAALKVAEKVL